MRPLLVALLAILIAECLRAEPPPPPVNRHLARSTWPIYHANTYASASVLSVPTTDPVTFQTVDNLTHRRFGTGNVSPWTVLREPAADGTQVVMTTPVNGIAKYVIENGRLRGVDFLKLDRRFIDFDWGILLLADGSALVTEKQHNRFAIIGDERADPRSRLTVVRRISIDADKFGIITAHFTIGYDGTVVALTEKPTLIAIDPQTGRVLASLDLPKELGLTSHNSFPMDERGRLYFVGQQMMFAVDWDGKAFQMAWQSPYNMRGPGFEDEQHRGKLRDVIAVAQGEAGTGSGTTPSLIGDPKKGIVVVVDGHSPKNNLVAFWRDEIPADWEPLPNPYDPKKQLDRRVAGVFALPHSTPNGEGHSAENSPAVLGNAVVVAQWAGFNPDGTPPKGVQRVDWDPTARRLQLVWANPDAHINGVPTIGRGSSGLRVFGMGRDGDAFVYSILDLATGQLVRQINLGNDEAVLDQGNQHVIAADGSIIYAGKKKLVHLVGP